MCTSVIYFSSVLVTAKSLKRTSVFERLGSESKADTSTANKVEIVLYLLTYFICLFRVALHFAAFKSTI